MRDDGLLAGPLDIDGPRRSKPVYPVVLAEPGLVVENRANGIVGAIISFNPPRLTIRDHSGRDHVVRYADGAIRVDNQPVTLRRPAARADQAPTTTASGSVSSGPVPARMARASRIWVEGIHDAELVEKVWGDDLRGEGVVVEPLDGADDLAERVRTFSPRSGRRIGVLLDHLVDGSKESRIASAINHPDVMIAGHPFVDIWQAVKPSVAGIDAWPTVPLGQPWKEGVLEALGITVSTGEYWKQLRGRVTTWTDLEIPLINAVESLIDFVAPPQY